MPDISRIFGVLPSLFFLLLAACSTAVPDSLFIRAEPEVGSVQTRSPRTLRLYYEKLPDVSRSEVVLRGPQGELNLRGLHTMGANDLMMEIYDEVVDGQYSVRWRTYVEGDPNPHEGSFQFFVQVD